MIISILKKDLKRKKTMNIILVLFIILSAMFAAAGISNIVTVMNGTGYFFDKAEIGTNVFLTMGQNMHGKTDGVFDDKEYVNWSKTEEVIYASQGSFFGENGDELEIHNAAILQSLEDAQMKFFDEKNECIDRAEPGEVYITAQMMKDNGLVEGDYITIRIEDVEEKLQIKGRLKDALLGATFVGNPRFLMSREDYETFDQNEKICVYYGGQICYQEVTDQKAFASALSEVDGVNFKADRALLTMAYVMDMIIAGLVLVVSLCLIIISFVVLKFTISFTLAEEFREIGVMKAIGLKNHKIRSIYLIKYMALALCGSIIGFGLSFPFSKSLLGTVSSNMVLGNDNAVGIQVLSAMLVLLIVVGYSYLCTGKLNRYTPLDAIRNGQTGERFKKKTVYRIGKSKLRPTSYMAINDVLSSPKRFLTILLAFMLCTLLVFVIVNTEQTMKSDSLITTFSKRSDAYYTNNTMLMKSMVGRGHGAMEDALDSLEKEMDDLGMPAKCCIDVQYTLPVEFDGVVNKLVCQQGIRTRASEYEYYEGSAPANAHEIAITESISRITGAKLGDIVKITVGGKQEDYLVTAYFESMNLMGEVIRLHEDVPTNMEEASNTMAFQFDFTDNPSQKEIGDRVQKMKDHFDSEQVFDAAGFAADCVQVADTMEAVSYLMLVITLVVVILVSILMERSFISDETSEIALLKAIGMKDKDVTSWHIKRFMFVGVLAVLLAVILSVPATHLMITPIFKMMGMHKVHYRFNLVKLLLIYPGIILVVTAVSVAATALYIKRIQSRDTANIE